MDLKSIKALYAPVGDKRLKALSSIKDKEKAKRFISEESVKLVLNIIRTSKKITRKKLLEKPISETRINYAVQILFEKELIVKTRNMKVSGYPVTYSIATNN